MGKKWNKVKTVWNIMLIAVIGMIIVMGFYITKYFIVFLVVGGIALACLHDSPEKPPES